MLPTRTLIGQEIISSARVGALTAGPLANESVNLSRVHPQPRNLCDETDPPAEPGRFEPRVPPANEHFCCFAVAGISAKFPGSWRADRKSQAST